MRTTSIELSQLACWSVQCPPKAVLHWPLPVTANWQVQIDIQYWSMEHSETALCGESTTNTAMYTWKVNHTSGFLVAKQAVHLTKSSSNFSNASNLGDKRPRVVCVACHVGWVVVRLPLQLISSNYIFVSSTLFNHVGLRGGSRKVISMTFRLARRNLILRCRICKKNETCGCRVTPSRCCFKKGLRPKCRPRASAIESQNTFTDVVIVCCDCGRLSDRLLVLRRGPLWQTGWVPRS